jgi:hypothetical protein
MAFKKQSLSGVRTLRNTQIHPVGRMRDFIMLKQIIHVIVITGLGRALSQAVSRRVPTAEALVRTQVRLYGIYGEQNGTRTLFF